MSRAGVEVNGADWSFADDLEWMSEFTRRVSQWAVRYGVDPDDMVQQSMIWAAGKHDVHTLKPAQAAMRCRGIYRPLVASEREVLVDELDDSLMRKAVERISSELERAISAILTEKELEAALGRAAGFTFAEIADDLDVSEKAIRLRIQSARKRIKESGLLAECE